MKPRFRFGCLAFVLLLTSACRSHELPPLTCFNYGTPEGVSQRPSPFDSVMLRTDTVLQAKLCYSRPSVRGRVVFGDLVPYDTLWRTGANEATVLHLAQATEIAGLPVAAGDYSIYTVPNPGEWLVVVNESTRQWGLTRDETPPGGTLQRSNYTESVRAQEVGRARIETEEIPFVERLTAEFETIDPGLHHLLIDWETARIVVPIQFVPES